MHIMPTDADMFQHGGRPTRSNMAAADACMPFGIVLLTGLALDALYCKQPSPKTLKLVPMMITFL